MSSEWLRCIVCNVFVAGNASSIATDTIPEVKRNKGSRPQTNSDSLLLSPKFRPRPAWAVLLGTIARSYYASLRKELCRARSACVSQYQKEKLWVDNCGSREWEGKAMHRDAPSRHIPPPPTSGCVEAPFPHVNSSRRATC